MPFDSPSRRRLALERFAAFFTELEGSFLERTDVLHQVALALLCREHALMTGPPGTGKSRVANAVLGRIVDSETGEPSLFSRQFTESTVQTDLIGPVDFKTLTETGRTEHFTDEGMLGAVHAFLDEVLDGRDMLLRSTLNLLEERELKEGARVTRGEIECALMTSNRYLSEVMATSRDALLAFVDRVSFVSFVPRLFADPANLEEVVRSVTSNRGIRLRRKLTIQDLDVLQAMTDETVVGPAACRLLTELTLRFEREILEAERSDPSFVPTRYLSTRAVVRLAKILKGACVLDKAMGHPDRALVVEARDFECLRLGMMLCGPGADELGKLLDLEADPRERRQLSIMQVEYEIFDRCLAGLGPELMAAVDREAQEVGAQRAVVESPDARPSPSVNIVDPLPKPTSPGDIASSPLDFARDALAKAEALDGESPDGQRHAAWLRGRALRTLSEWVALGGLHPVTETEVEDADGGRDEIAVLIDGFQAAHETRGALRAGGAQGYDEAHEELQWLAAYRDTEQRIRELWDDVFRFEVLARAESSGEPREFDKLLGALAAIVSEVDASEAALRAVYPGVDAPEGGRSLKARVASPRLEPLLRESFARLELRSRMDLAGAVRGMRDQLDECGLELTVPVSEMVAWAGARLLAGEVADQAPAEPSFDGYRALREAEERVSITFALADCLSRLTGYRGTRDQDVRDLLSSVADPPWARVAAADLARVERATSCLERWWDARPESGDGELLAVVYGESALVRYALECRLVGTLLPVPTEASDALLERLHDLHRRIAADRTQHRADRAELDWASVVGG